MTDYTELQAVVRKCIDDIPPSQFHHRMNHRVVSWDTTDSIVARVYTDEG
ncbi:MAG: hypothetical protein OXG88_03330 [Gammaproteobacteria bacterium]|nr:hypothetical protein [Gammaproteobacteria bacterium]